MAKKTTAKRAKPNNVKTLRTELGMFQNDLAKSAKISVASVRGTESMSRSLSQPLKARIVTALGREAVNQGKVVFSFKDVFPND